MDFDYKKYSLEKLEEWVNDAIMCSEASPQEVYDTIKKVVQENFDAYQKTTERCRELLYLLDGVKNLELDLSDLSEYYGINYDNMSSTGIGGSDDYIHFNIDAAGNEVKICDKDDPSTECKGAWNDFWEENYYPEEHSKHYYDYDRNDLGRPNPFEDRVKKWQLPVEVDAANDEYFVCFPDDLLEAANLKEGDEVEWVDQGYGSYLLKKAENPTNEFAKV